MEAQSSSCFLSPNTSGEQLSLHGGDTQPRTSGCLQGTKDGETQEISFHPYKTLGWREDCFKELAFFAEQGTVSCIGLARLVELGLLVYL